MEEKIKNKTVSEQEEKKVLTDRIVAALNLMPIAEMRNAVFYLEGKASNFQPPKIIS